jgi:hypothetical protein
VDDFEMDKGKPPSSWGHGAAFDSGLGQQNSGLIQQDSGLGQQDGGLELLAKAAEMQGYEDKPPSSWDHDSLKPDDGETKFTGLLRDIKFLMDYASKDSRFKYRRRSCPVSQREVEMWQWVSDKEHAGRSFGGL